MRTMLKLLMMLTTRKRDALENEDSALEDLDNFLVDKDLDDSLADDEPLEDCEDVLDEHTDVVSE